MKLFVAQGSEVEDISDLIITNNVFELKRFLKQNKIVKLERLKLYHNVTDFTKGFFNLIEIVNCMNYNDYLNEEITFTIYVYSL